ncbi:hypothetical protein HQQ80_19075 [Microbacteriaceae bacterium VKM Ac-2855]|nr:hypothetical protein [Microbacteriaceae bacterium VKM Ac-2855]
MKRVDISYAGQLYSIADQDPAQIRQYIQDALISGEPAWLVANQGEGLPRKVSLLIGAGIPIAITDELA